ncbi:uncharacterized protein PITG_21409 [Phytophthora infestans T30-4]|uniref:Uncharacterized protein n=1 Tax=Phytophthora infestans (strain T30-4) TaxID=403677 RepID=D0P3R5_PHYIT|nr:uncharacterized protein PITG_21409 [Phytophthora infestans T30-4]EEY60721.1 hypothetical protein PITG_21409 [Phytophthora infestans T30-4]|eukprot:XP_002895058.1 hypothetical protein PITG_21409 [Phytophthora infestans T30-4]
MARTGTSTTGTTSGTTKKCSRSGQVGGGSLMVWARMSHYGKTEIAFLEGRYANANGTELEAKVQRENTQPRRSLSVVIPETSNGRAPPVNLVKPVGHRLLPRGLPPSSGLAVPVERVPVLQHLQRHPVNPQSRGQGIPANPLSNSSRQQLQANRRSNRLQAVPVNLHNNNRPLLQACENIVIKDLSVPASTTLDLTKVAKGATITFEGTSTFEYAEWEGPLVLLTGIELTVMCPVPGNGGVIPGALPPVGMTRDPGNHSSPRRPVRMVPVEPNNARAPDRAR